MLVAWVCVAARNSDRMGGPKEAQAVSKLHKNGSSKVWDYHHLHKRSIPPFETPSAGVFFCIQKVDTHLAPAYYTTYSRLCTEDFSLKCKVFIYNYYYSPYIIPQAADFVNSLAELLGNYWELVGNIGKY